MHNIEGNKNHHSLFLVIGWQDSVKHLEAGSPRQPGPACSGLGRHALRGPPKDEAGRSEEVGAPGWVGVQLVEEEDQVLQLVSLEIARNIDALTTHGHRLLAQ